MARLAAVGRGPVVSRRYISLLAGAAWAGSFDRSAARFDRPRRHDCRPLYAGPIILLGSESDWACLRRHLFADPQSDLRFRNDFGGRGGSHDGESRAAGDSAGAHTRADHPRAPRSRSPGSKRSEEHTSELQSPCNLVCRLLLEKKNKNKDLTKKKKKKNINTIN